MVVEEWSSFPEEPSAVQNDCVGKRAETLTLFRHKVGEQVLQDFVGYNPKRRVRSYAEGRIMSIALLFACCVTVVHIIGKTENRIEHHQKKYADTSRRMVETATKK